MLFNIFYLCTGLDVKFMDTGMAFRFIAAAVNTTSGNNGDIRSLPYMLSPELVDPGSSI
jgi:hypothetical protein